MIDINELRRLTQAATPGPWGNTDPDPTIINSPYNQLAICYRNSRALTDAKFIAAVNPAAASELLDRLEAAERAVTEAYQRGYATGQEEIEKEREALRAENAALVEDMNLLRNNNVALRAKIERMERQEPVKYEFQDRDGKWYPFIDQRHYENTVAVGAWPIRSLYTLPGAKGE